MPDDFIYGKKPVLEAIKAGRGFEKIFLSQGNPFYQELKNALAHTDIYIQQVPEQKLNRITRKNHQGVIAYPALVTYQSLDDVLAQVYEQGQTPLFVALDGVTDVGNFGAIARSAFCFGAQAIIVPTKGRALINGISVKASAGAIQKINICRVDYFKDSLSDLQSNGLSIIAANMSQHATDISMVDLTIPCCIVLGNEEKGVGNQIIQMADTEAFIPMANPFDSLNVSVASGVILYEAMRQRINS